MIQDALMVKNREFFTRRVMALELQALHSLGTAREREKKTEGQNPSPETNLYTHDTTWPCACHLLCFLLWLARGAESDHMFRGVDRMHMVNSKGILCLKYSCMQEIGKKLPRRSLVLHNVSDTVEDTKSRLAGNSCICESLRHERDPMSRMLAVPSEEKPQLHTLREHRIRKVTAASPLSKWNFATILRRPLTHMWRFEIAWLCTRPFEEQNLQHTNHWNLLSKSCPFCRKDSKTKVL